MDSINPNSYRWIKNRLGFAIITLDVKQSDNNYNQVFENYADTESKGRATQGAIIEVSNTKPDSWKAAAHHGLEYAFSLTNKYWSVNIHKIEGVFTDTNPTVIAYVTMKFFLDTIGQELDSDKVLIFEEFIRDSWKLPYDKEFLPNFYNFTFIEFN